MAVQQFKRQLNGVVSLDICFPCQGIWFDEFESAQLAPAGVLELFRLLHEHHADLRQPWRDVLQCPRCRERLMHRLDSTRNGRFAYSRCPQRHGRYSAFAAFMIEKGFVRQLSGAEIREISARIAVVRCTGCGAPVDIRKQSACGHCRAPIAILDPQAVEQALAGYHRAAVKQAAPTDPAALAEAVLLTERERSRRQRERGTVLDADLGDLLLDGVAMVWNRLS